MHRLTGAGDGAPKRYPAKFRRKVLDLFASGRPEAEAQVAYDLQIVRSDKAGNWTKWYARMIPRAEQLYEIYLKERAAEEGRQ